MILEARQKLALIITGLGVFTFFPSCAPAITHAPRVEPGWSAGASISYGPEGELGNADYEPEANTQSAVLWLRHGWKFDADQWSYLAGVQVPVFPYLIFAGEGSSAGYLPVGPSWTALDVYASVPRTWAGEWDAGIGLQSAVAFIAPYIQLGRQWESGAGFYSSHMASYAFSHAIAPDDQPFWISSVAGRIPIGASIFIHPRISAGFGRNIYQLWDYDRGGYTIEAWHWFVAPGITIELR